MKSWDYLSFGSLNCVLKKKENMILVPWNASKTVTEVAFHSTAWLVSDNEPLRFSSAQRAEAAALALYLRPKYEVEKDRII